MKKSMRSITAGVLSMAIAMSIQLAPATGVVSAAPVDVFKEACTSGNSKDSELCRNKGDQLFGPKGVWRNIVNTLIFVVGAVAVLMIVIGGFKYVISNGDQSAITSAKNTILYSVVGLVVAFSAYAIVNFVLTVLK